VRRSAHEFDAALAGGADPLTSEELTLRARQLAEPQKRERLASSIGDLIEAADRVSTARLPVTRAPFPASRVQANRQSLVRLVERLRGDEPHAVKGLAMANLLVEDGRSPLYAHQLSGDPLGPALKATLSAIDP
jgi:hypothetical protein